MLCRCAPGGLGVCCDARARRGGGIWSRSRAARAARRGWCTGRRRLLAAALCARLRADRQGREIPAHPGAPPSSSARSGSGGAPTVPTPPQPDHRDRDSASLDTHSTTSERTDQHPNRPPTPDHFDTATAPINPATQRPARGAGARQRSDRAAAPAAPLSARTTPPLHPSSHPCPTCARRGPPPLSDPPPPPPARHRYEPRAQSDTGPYFT